MTEYQTHNKGFKSKYYNSTYMYICIELIKYNASFGIFKMVVVSHTKT